MNHQSREPEYILASQQEKTSQEWDLLRISHLKFKAQVQERSRLLYKAVCMSRDISEEILDLVRELEQLREER